MKHSFHWLADTLGSFIPISASSTDVDTNSNSTAYLETSSKHQKQKKKSSTPVKGLQNLGNTCFFNASVQALLACPLFVEYLSMLSTKRQQLSAHSQYTPYEPPARSSSSSASTMLATTDANDHKWFCQLLLDVCDCEETMTSPTDLFARICQFHPSEFQQFVQSDAHESFNKMMELLEIEQAFICMESQSAHIIHDMFDFLHLDEEQEQEQEQEEKTDTHDHHSLISNVKNPFHGLLASTLECTRCRYAKESRQTSFTCLTLSLVDALDKVRSAGNVTLLQRIHAFGVEESIDGYRCMFCELNGMLADIHQQLAHLDKHAANYVKHMHKLQRQQQECMSALHQLVPHRLQQNGYALNGGMNGWKWPTAAATHTNSNSISISNSYRTTAKKRQFVSRLPQVLCIHLNRLQFGVKDGRFVKFDTTLNLYAHTHTHNDRHRHEDADDDNEYFALVSASLPNEYLLMAVIVHHGNDSCGHYTTYKRRVRLPNCRTRPLLQWSSAQELQLIEKYSEWYHISDEFVNKVSINQVRMCQVYAVLSKKSNSYIKDIL